MSLPTISSGGCGPPGADATGLAGSEKENKQ
jgi:hypothetical protein